MKKRYMLAGILVVFSLWGCVIKAPTLPEVSTWEILTWAEFIWVETGGVTTWEVIVWEVLTWAFDSGVVPVVTGSDWVNVNTGVTAEVTQLIDERKTQSWDQNKLTEEDIGLIEKVIEKMKWLWK